MHDVDVESNQCHSCDERFYTKAAFYVHKTCHENNKELESFLVICDYCHWAGYNELDLISHHQEKHINNPMTFEDTNDYDNADFDNTDFGEHEFKSEEIDPYDHVEVTEQIFECSLCHKKLKSEQSLKTHMKKCKEAEDTSQTFVCELCVYTAPSIRKLKDHQKSVHFDRRQCPHCEKSCSDKGNLEIHMDRHHPGIKPLEFDCDKCPKRFMFRPSLTKHLHSHKQSALVAQRERLQCEHCDVTYGPSCLVKLVRHEYAVHGIQRYPNVCKKCKQPYKDTHTSCWGQVYTKRKPGGKKGDVKKERFQCCKCEATFSTTWILDRHEYMRHGIKKHPNVCEKCHQPYKDVHTACTGVVKNRTKKFFPCGECDKVYTSKISLDIHINSFHKNERNFKCTLCDKAFGGAKTLSSHYGQCHDIQTCPHCQKSLANKLALRRHMVYSHDVTDGAIFCNICPKKVFFSQTMYTNHMQRAHSE